MCVCTLAAEEVNDPLVICRVYACIADMLAFMAKEGGIRAGPAANKAWRIAFILLEVHKCTKINIVNVCTNTHSMVQSAVI